MYDIDRETLKYSFATHAVPLEAMAGVVPLQDAPRQGQLVAAEVVSLHRHTAIEGPRGYRINIFPGDQLVGVFGNRYASDQYEGYVPEHADEVCDILSVGGVIGRVATQHVAMKPPTQVRVLGAVCDPDGRPLCLREFGLRPVADNGQGQVILVVGSAMNSGKTTMVGTLARALVQANFRVGAAKITGTSTSKDPRYFWSCGARPVLDFTDAGYPSTYMLDLDELLGISRTLVAHVRSRSVDYILLEIADGLLQRETAMLLGSPEFRAGIDHVFYTAGDSLCMPSGVQILREYGLPLRASGGAIGRSPLGLREARAAIDLPCLTTEEIMEGAVLDLIGAPKRRTRAPGATTTNPHAQPAEPTTASSLEDLRESETVLNRSR